MTYDPQVAHLQEAVDLLRQDIQTLWGVINNQRETLNALQAASITSTGVTGECTRTLQHLTTIIQVEAEHALALSTQIKEHEFLLTDLLKVRAVINAPSNN